MDVQRKLEILADAAKYDASCASSGTKMRDSSGGASGMGICHSYAPDGRCISLLKVLLTMPATTIASIASTAPQATCRARCPCDSYPLAKIAAPQLRPPRFTLLSHAPS
jgi:hypothetical protein